MWKMIIGQALFQMTATFILHFAGPRFLPYPEAEMRTIIFNVFVWLQIFNQYNNRRLDNKLNIFVGIHKNYYFIAMNIIMVGCQVVIIYFGSTAFSIVELNGNQWAISVVVALLCVPWGICVRLFPDAWFGAIAKFVGVPFVAVYRPLARVTDRVSRKMESKKKSKETDEDASDESSCRGRGKSPVETIKVPGDAEKHVL
jgi:Ca2+-transporting ATPase